MLGALKSLPGERQNRFLWDPLRVCTGKAVQCPVFCQRELYQFLNQRAPAADALRCVLLVGKLLDENIVVPDFRRSDKVGTRDGAYLVVAHGPNNFPGLRVYGLDQQVAAVVRGGSARFLLDFKRIIPLFYLLIFARENEQ